MQKHAKLLCEHESNLLLFEEFDVKPQIQLPQKHS